MTAKTKRRAGDREAGAERGTERREDDASHEELLAERGGHGDRHQRPEPVQRSRGLERGVERAEALDVAGGRRPDRELQLQEPEAQHPEADAQPRPRARRAGPSSTEGERGAQRLSPRRGRRGARAARGGWSTSTRIARMDRRNAGSGRHRAPSPSRPPRPRPTRRRERDGGGRGVVVRSGLGAHRVNHYAPTRRLTGPDAQQVRPIDRTCRRPPACDHRFRPAA